MRRMRWNGTGGEVVAQINVIAVERDIHDSVSVRICVVRVVQIRLQFRFGDIGVSAYRYHGVSSFRVVREPSAYAPSWFEP